MFLRNLLAWLHYLAPSRLPNDPHFLTAAGTERTIREGLADVAVLRNRAVSGRDILLVFSSSVFVVYSWEILMFLEKLPGWLLHLSSWDLISIFAYSQLFALFESTLVLLCLIIAGAILPAKLLRHGFATKGSLVVLLTAGWAIIAHCNNFLFIRHLDYATVLLWSTSYLASLALFYLLVHRCKRFEQTAVAFVERLTVLLYIYIPVTCLSAIIAVVRRFSAE